MTSCYTENRSILATVPVSINRMVDVIFQSKNIFLKLHALHIISCTQDMQQQGHISTANQIEM